MNEKVKEIISRLPKDICGYIAWIRKQNKSCMATLSLPTARGFADGYLCALISTGIINKEEKKELYKYCTD